MATKMEQLDSGVHLDGNETDGLTNCSVSLASPTAVEIESLKQALLEKDGQLLLMENACLRESERQVELEDSVIAWQDKYDRLYESHKRVQKINQTLEDKLLKMVDRNTGERAQLTSDVATLSVRLAQANFNIAKLQREIERYKADISLAIQLLHCKPDSFMPQKMSSLPIDMQSKVSSYMRLESNSHSDSEGSGVGVVTTASYKELPASESPPPAPCPFPPTAMVYSMRGLDAKNNPNAKTNQLKRQCNNNNNNNNNSNEMSPSVNNNNNNNCNSKNNITNMNLKNNNNTNGKHLNGSLGNDPDLISPLMMAKFLENELKVDETKHCDTCQCSKRDLTVLADVSRFYTVATQTPLLMQTTMITSNTNLNDPLGGQLCMRCHSNLNSPSRTNSPFLMKVVKSSDSVISETKSSVSDLNDVDKLFTPPPKKDDLMVNPILGHHRLCDRTIASNSISGGTVNGTIPLKKPESIKSIKTKTDSLATMFYSTTHLGAFEAEKYLMETNMLAGVRAHLRGNDLRGNNERGYQRRFLDGGGSALCLLNGNMGSSTKNNNNSIQDTNGLLDEALDEEKPLLCEDLVFLQREPIKRDIASLDVLQDAIKSPTSTCSASDIHKKLTKSAITSSMNSLWSKGSNCESSKIFENFNRNLIRTIKSENPRYRGPRLCAMRIQRTENGQSNILLDNMESLETVTPVVYRRRERLLDEELDDTKDIITSGSPTMNRTPIEPKVTVCSNETFEELTMSDGYRHIYLDDANWSKKDLKCEEIESVYQEENPFESQAVTELLISTDFTDDTNANDLNKLKTPNDRNSEQDIRVTVELSPCDGMALSSSKAVSKQTTSSYEVLRNDCSSKNSINSISCTQSNSTSEAINLQESVILRRQQLSRVAQWVQSNTEQLQHQQAQPQDQQQKLVNTNPTTPQCDSSGTDRQSSFSTLDQLDSVSIEKLSMDSGYKTTPQQQTNGLAQTNRMENNNIIINNNNNIINNIINNNINNNNNIADQSNEISQSTKTETLSQGGNISQPVSIITANNNQKRSTMRLTEVTGAFNTIPTESDGHPMMMIDQNEDTNIAILPEQPTCDILNYKYYPCERDKSRAVDAELHMTSTNVDIAQMEYNVKQFLLKQNEWSMRAASYGTSTDTTTAAAAAVAAVITAQRPKAIRRSKLFSSVGIGPGVGERVRTEMPTNASTDVRRQLTAPKPTAHQTTIPQRTETNL